MNNEDKGEIIILDVGGQKTALVRYARKEYEDAIKGFTVAFGILGFVALLVGIILW